MRLLYGSTNTVANIQDRIQADLRDIEERMIVRIDYHLMFEKAEEGLLNKLECFYDNERSIT